MVQTQNILIKFILALLDIFAKNWSYETMFNYLKIGLLDIPKEDIYLLENYCIKWGIKGSKWHKEFSYEEINDNQEKLETLRKRIVIPLVEFKTNISSNKTSTQITKEIYNFIINNKINEILDLKLKQYNNIELILEKEFLDDDPSEVLEETFMTEEKQDDIDMIVNEGE